jgi:hypothetical protein
MFGSLLKEGGSADRFRFGRDADGTPAASLGWEDLDLEFVHQLRGQSAQTPHLLTSLRRLSMLGGHIRVVSADTEEMA